MSRIRSATPIPAVHGAVDDDPLLAERLALGLDRRQGGRGDDGGGALDVVVERADLVAVVLQDPVGVVGAQVLPVQQRVGVAPPDRVDEPGDELVILLAADPGTPQAQV
jgi:hypothetical protein